MQGFDAGMSAWVWLDVLWRLGAFALLAIAVNLGILARIKRSRVLAVITCLYAVTVCLVGWRSLQQVMVLLPFDPFADSAILLPAAVLVLAGLGAIAGESLRALRARTSQPRPGEPLASS